MTEQKTTPIRCYSSAPTGCVDDSGCAVRGECELAPATDWLPAQLAASRDDAAVNAFARAMTDKMARSRAKGRGGWQSCAVQDLWQMLREHVEKGDPVDVANLAMMIWHNAQKEPANV